MLYKQRGRRERFTHVVDALQTASQGRSPPGNSRLDSDDLWLMLYKRRGQTADHRAQGVL